jgi:hypothetical protein
MVSAEKIAQFRGNNRDFRPSRIFALRFNRLPEVVPSIVNPAVAGGGS